MDSGTVYRAKNVITGKSYVGQTWYGLNYRKLCHEKDALKEELPILPFHRALRKYGLDAFEWSVLFSGLQTQEEMDLFEREAILVFRSLDPGGYNLREGGSCGRHHADTRHKMSLVRKGKTYEDIFPADEALRQRNLRSVKRGKYNPEQGRKISIARTGMSFSLKHRKSISVAQNKRFADGMPSEHKKNISAALSGKPKTDDHIRNLRKLKKDDWIEILRLYVECKWSQSAIARRFDLNSSTVCRFVNNPNKTFDKFEKIPDKE